MGTKITTASVRVMRSIDYGNYETALTVENADGLTEADVTDCIEKCHVLTSQSIDMYLKAKAEESRSIQTAEKGRIGSVLNDLKQLVPEKVIAPVDPAVIAQVEALPMYEPKKQAVPVLKKINAKTIKA